MKPKHLFWIACAAFIALAVKTGMQGERYITLLVIAGAIASAANAMRAEANKTASWKEVKKMFGIN